METERDIGGPCAVLAAFQGLCANEFVSGRARVVHDRAVVVDVPNSGTGSMHLRQTARDVRQRCTRDLSLAVRRNAVPGAVVLAVDGTGANPLIARGAVVVDDLW